MIFKFNGGMGAILCSKCRRILAQGSDIPQEVWNAKDKSSLPDWYCNDGCKGTHIAMEEVCEYCESSIGGVCELTGCPILDPKKDFCGSFKRLGD